MSPEHSGWPLAALLLACSVAAPLRAQPAPPAAGAEPPQPGVAQQDTRVRRGTIPADAGPPPLPTGLMPPGGPGGPPGGPGGTPGADVSYTAALRVMDGSYNARRSVPADVHGGHSGDTYASGLRIRSAQPNLNGVLVQGGMSAYTLSDATLDLSGIGTSDFQGIGAGAMVTGGVLVLRSDNITMAGAVRSAVVANDGAILKVYDTTLVAHGGPLPPGYVHHIGPGMMEAPAPLGITGTARTALTMGKSESYFHHSRIIADGWGALSTDATGGYVYVQAEDCDITVRNSGYGTYADAGAHVAINASRMDVATFGAIMAGTGDVRFTDVTGRSGNTVAMIHSVMGNAQEMADFAITGGAFASRSSSILVKSANARIVLDKAGLTPADGVLVRSIVNDDANRTRPNGQPVPGIRLRIANGAYTGDLLHQDTERPMLVTLDHARLTGAVQRATLIFDPFSHWTARGNSAVTLGSAADLAHVDAGAGIRLKVKLIVGPALRAGTRLSGGGTADPG